METELRNLKNRLQDLVSEEKINEGKDGISLLDLKNQALLAYLNDLAVIIGSKINDDRVTRIKATKGTIEQRVTLEKGIKGLEAKVTYQIDKALRAYKREQDQQKEQEKSDSESDDSDEDSDADLTAYRPNVNALKDEESESEAETTKYVAPKIAKTAIPTKERRHKRRDFAMEEYLKDQADAPTAEPSIGAAIMDGGRGGQSTEFERRKEREIQDFEEANFTRVGTTSSKKLRKEAAKRQHDALSRNAFGENWDFLDKGRGRGDRNNKRSKRK